MLVPTFFIIPHTIPPTRVELHVTHTKTNPKNVEKIDIVYVDMTSKLQTFFVTKKSNVKSTICIFFGAIFQD